MKTSTSDLIIVTGAGLGLWFLLKNRAVTANFKSGDVLSIGDSYTYTVIGVQSAGDVKQYVLQQSVTGSIFSLDVSFVDSNPAWHLVTGV